MNARQKTLNYKYLKDITTLDVKGLLNSYRIKVYENDKNSIDGYYIDCPFIEGHEKAVVFNNGKDSLPTFNCIYCANKTFEDFLDLFDKDIINKHCSSKVVFFEGDDKPFFSDVANIIYNMHDIVVDKNGIIYKYNNSFWEEVSTQYIKSLILEIVSDVFFTNKLCNETINLIVSKCQSKQYIKFNNLEPYEIPCKNGIFNVKDETFYKHKKENYLLSVINTDYIEGLRNHDFETLAFSWFENYNFNNTEDYREEGITLSEEDFRAALNIKAGMDDLDCLQEFSGFCLMPKARYKKALLLHGEPHTGKSIYFNVLKSIIGEHNCCGVSVESMDDPKKLSPIKGKMLNAISELSKDSMIKDGGFKTLVSGGDSIMIDEKYKPQQMIEPDCKHVIVTNNLPYTVDTTDAVFDRFIILNFINIIPAKDRDAGLTRRLLNNPSGILNWMIDGAIRLYKNNGHFTVSFYQNHMVKEIKKSNNPINYILDNYFQKDEKSIISLKEITDVYRSEQYKNATEKSVARNLRDAKIEVFRTKYKGIQRNCVAGYRLLEEDFSR